MTAQSTLLNTVSIGDFTDLVERIFVDAPGFVQSEVRSLYREMPIVNNTGDTRRFEEYDTETYAAVKPEGAPASYARTGTAYTKDMTLRRFAMNIEVTWEMRNRNKYQQVYGKMVSLAHFVPQRLQLDLTHRFTFAEATTYTDRDGWVVDLSVGDTLAVISSVHTLAFSSTTWSNVIPTNPAFSKGGLELAENMFVTNILSHFAERRVMTPNTIITSDDPTTCNDVYQLLESMGDATYNNASILNPYKGKFKHVKLPELATTATGARDATKAKRWFLAAIGVGSDSLHNFLGMEQDVTLMVPTPGSNGENVDTDNWIYGTRGSYGIVFTSGRGLVMSTGIGA